MIGHDRRQSAGATAIGAVSASGSDGDGAGSEGRVAATGTRSRGVVDVGIVDAAPGVASESCGSAGSVRRIRALPMGFVGATWPGAAALRPPAELMAVTVLSA